MCGSLNGKFSTTLTLFWINDMVTLIKPISDIHLESGPINIPVTDVDKQTILVLAGDIGLVHKQYDKQLYVEFLRLMSLQFKYVILVMGNHEHYHGSIKLTYSRIKNALTELKLNNVFLLEKESVVLDGVAFIGATLWTNCDYHSPFSPMLWRGMLDSQVIRNGPTLSSPYERKLSPEDTWKDHSEAIEFILSEIDKQTACGNKTVVVTHHAPSTLSIPDQYKTGPHSNLNMFFCSDLTMDIMDHNPDIWIHGHTHHCDEYLLDSTDQFCKTRIVSNQRGYVGYESTFTDQGFDVNKIIKI